MKIETLKRANKLLEEIKEKEKILNTLNKLLSENKDSMYRHWEYREVIFKLSRLVEVDDDEFAPNVENLIEEFNITSMFFEEVVNLFIIKLKEELEALQQEFEKL